MIYGRDTDNSTDGTDATRMIGRFPLSVSHHYSYDRQAEKEMGSTTRTAKTQKILGQAMVKPGRT